MLRRCAILLLLSILTGCEGLTSTGTCTGPFDTLVSSFTGTVTRDAISYDAVRLEGEQLEPIYGEPWAVPQWTRNQDVLLNGGRSPGTVSGSVAGFLHPGPDLKTFGFQVLLRSPLDLGDTIPAVEVTTPGCSFSGAHAVPDSVFGCVGMSDSLIPRALGVSGTIVVTARRPLALDLDLITDADPRVRYAVRGRLTFRQGRSPGYCYGSS